MDFLSIHNISKQEKENLVVNNISFVQQPFEKIAIAGSTGSGKTTLLKMIAGYIQPSAGEIKFLNRRIIGPLEQLIPGHPGIAYLSQHFELFNNYWVHEILEMANKLSEEEAQNIYAICRIEHLLKRRTSELSGGEKQRIALARLLTTFPKLLLLDEPFSNLDMMHKNIIKNVIHDIGTKLNITCMMVSHDPLDILSWADKIIILKDGNIIQEGDTQQLYTRPVNEYAAALLGNYNLIDTALFTNFTRIAVGGKKALIRPENFTLSLQQTTNAVAAKVLEVLFFGSYYMLHVLSEGQLIKVRSENHPFKKDDTVYLSTDASLIWYI